MDDHMMNNALDESDSFSSDSYGNSDSGPIYYCVESANNSDSQDPPDDEKQIEDHALPASNNNSQSKWNTVTGNNQNNLSFTGNSGPLVILDMTFTYFQYDIN